MQPSHASGADAPKLGAHGLDRRQLLKAGVWAAPAIVLATAAPAAAAGSGDVISAPVVVNKYAPNVGSYSNGTIQINSIQIWYDYNAWNLGGNNAQSDGPQTATVVWQIVVKDADGNVVKTIPQESVLAKYGNAQYQGSITGLAPGAYTVESQIVSVTFSPNPVNGVTFVCPSSSAATNVMVR